MMRKFLSLLAVAAAVVAMPGLAQASPLQILDYGGAGSMSALDNDANHVYTFLPAGNLNWQNASYLSQFDVITIGVGADSSATRLLDLTNPAITALTSSANAVLTTMFHGHFTTGERQMWTQSVEWAASGPGVGIVTSYSGGNYDFTPFAPGSTLSGFGSGNNPLIVDPLHPIVAGLISSDLIMNFTTHNTFAVIPSGFSVVVVEQDAGNLPIVLVRGGIAAVPEPSALALLGLGGVGLAVFRRCKSA